MASLTVHSCVACGACEFPPRLLCPACGARDFVEIDAGLAKVEEVTALHRRPGEDGGDGAPAWLATVLTAAGPRVIARLEHPFGAGAVVTLSIEADGAILARPPTRDSSSPPPHAA
jgi:uncharacterized OB-fold protein